MAVIFTIDPSNILLKVCRKPDAWFLFADIQGKKIIYFETKKTRCYDVLYSIMYMN